MQVTIGVPFDKFIEELSKRKKHASDVSEDASAPVGTDKENEDESSN